MYKHMTHELQKNYTVLCNMQESNNAFNGFDHLYPYQNDDIEFNAEILNSLLHPTQDSNDGIPHQMT